MRYALALAVLAAGSVLAAGLILGDGAAADEHGKSLVTVVTTPEPQTQLMSMVLTMQAVDQGVRARVLLCGPAGDIALDDAPATATAPQAPAGASPQGLLRALTAKGVPVEVCALYLPNKDLEPAALIDGIGVAAPPAMAQRLLADNTVVLSF